MRECVYIWMQKLDVKGSTVHFYEGLYVQFSSKNII